MQITVQHLDDAQATLALDGRLNLVSAAALRDAVAEAVDGGRPRLVVDLGAVTFIDSTGLGALIAGLKHARQAGGELRIAAAGRQALTVIQMTRLDRVLRPYPSVDDALVDL